MEDALKTSGAKDGFEQKGGDYYQSGMDTIAIEKVGAEPLKAKLAKIDAIKDTKEMMNFLAEENVKGEGDLLAMYVAGDEKNSTQNIASFYQTALTLPEKGYYTRADSATAAARTALTSYAEKLFTLTGSDAATAAKNAKTVLALETEIAKSHRTPAEQRDPQKNYNKMSLAVLDAQRPNIGWSNFFSKMNVKVDSVNIGQPGYYTALNQLLISQPVDAWKTKLKFDYIFSNAGLLSKNFRDAAFAYNQKFSGQKKESDRWKKMVSRTNNALVE